MAIDPAPAKMQQLRHGGTVTAYRREGAGPSILFLHNGGTCSTIWRNQVDDLRNRFDVTAVDLPGFGASPRSRVPMDLNSYAENVGALISALGLAPVVMVGNCMGSNIACTVASAQPETVAALVLINPLTERTFGAGRIGVLHRMHSWAPGPARFLRSAARRFVPTQLVARETLRFELGPRGIALALHHDPELLACNRRRDQMPALVDVLDDMDSYGSLDHVGGELADIPICTVIGTRNRVLSPQAMRSFSERLQPEESFELEGCGHLAMLEDPDTVTGIIAAFASKHCARVGGTGQ